MASSPSSSMIYGIKISNDIQLDLVENLKTKELIDIIKDVGFNKGHFLDNIDKLLTEVNEKILKLYNAELCYDYSSYLGEYDEEVVIGFDLKEANANDYFMDLIDFKELINQHRIAYELYHNNNVIKDLLLDLSKLFDSKHEVGVYLLTSYC